MAEAVKIGYARVSSEDQNLDRQLIQLKEAGVNERHIFTDKKSGAINVHRPGFEQMMSFIRPGDIVVISSLDRLGRDAEKLSKDWQAIKDAGATLEVLDMPFLNARPGDTISEMMAKVAFDMLAYISQLEREHIKERQRQGIEAAKMKGKQLGRPERKKPADWQAWYTRWLKGEVTKTELMKELKVAHKTFVKWAGETEEGRKKLDANREAFERKIRK